MEIEIQKKRSAPLSERLTIPINEAMKKKIDNLKEVERIDFNEMIRRFLDRTIDEIESAA